MSAYDYQRYAILFVDPDAGTRRYFSRLFSTKFRLYETKSAGEALQKFREHAHEIAILIYEQNMVLEPDFAQIEKIIENFPNVIRLASVKFDGVDAAIQSVSRQEIHRYLMMPWDVAEVEITIRRAMEFYLLTEERDGLLRSKE